jgi:hypothetical protein
MKTLIIYLGIFFITLMISCDDLFKHNSPLGDLLEDFEERAIKNNHSITVILKEDMNKGEQKWVGTRFLWTMQKDYMAGDTIVFMLTK